MTFYDRLRKLLEWRGTPEHQVLSLYLDISGSGETQALAAAESLWEDARATLENTGAEALIEQILHDLPGEIAAAQAEGYDGLALFACRKPALHETFRLRFALENQLEVGHEPQTWQLAYYEEEYEQVVALSLGEHPEVIELHVGDVAAHHPVRPTHGRTPEQEASAVLHRILHDSPRAHLILLGAPDRRASLLRRLDPALQSRLIGVVDAALVSSDPAFLRTIHRVQQAYERRSEDEGVRALLDARSNPISAGAVAAGPLAVIEAINRATIQKLYILQGFEGRGWICDACDRLGLPPTPPVCTACGASVARAELKHHLIQQARACGAEIETIPENPALLELGGVAASCLAPSGIASIPQG
jgi:hypothetical protein